MAFSLIAQGQTVAISNVFHPGTGLEPGDTVGISISGATPGGSVTVIANGGTLYLYGYVLPNGTWSTTSPVVSANVGGWTEYWYVNGDPLTVSNPNATYVPKAPTLPTFTVYANASASCPVGIPGHVDQHSELMSITIPK